MRDRGLGRVVFEDGLTKIYKRATRGSTAAMKIRLVVLFLAFAEWPLERKLSGSQPSCDEVWLIA